MVRALHSSRSALEARTSDAGTLVVSGRRDPRDPAARAGCFERAFLELCGDWLARFPVIPVLACGMVGSDQGWSEARYLRLPTSVAAVGTRLASVPFSGGRLSIVPGLYHPGDPATGAAPDVIRGEEVQILGVLAGLPAGSAEVFLLLPGTHTKWVRCADGVVVDFVTAMSGELYGLVMSGSIVGRLAASPAPDHAAIPPAFHEGVTASGAGAGQRGLAAALFTGRTLVMGGRLDPTAVGDYVSGLLIGDEVAHMLRTVAAGRSEIYICGTSDLARRYAHALETHGVRPLPVREDAAVTGLWSIAAAAGLVDASGCPSQRPQGSAR